MSVNSSAEPTSINWAVFQQLPATMGTGAEAPLYNIRNPMYSLHIASN